MFENSRVEEWGSKVQGLGIPILGAKIFSDCNDLTMSGNFILNFVPQ